jgi:hypothetical protein
MTSRSSITGDLVSSSQDEERIIVAHGKYGVISLKYVGEDPETRYLPPAEDRWSRFREVVRQIFRDPPDRRAD